MKLSYVHDDASRNRFIGWLVGGESYRPWLGIDTETTGLSWKDTLRMVQFGDEEMGWALPYPQEAAIIADVLSHYQGEFVGQNMKFDANVLYRTGLPTGLLKHDTKLMAHLLNPAISTHLGDLAALHLGLNYAKMDKELKEEFKKTKTSYDTIPQYNPVYWQYAAADALITAKLASQLHPKVMERYGYLYEMETRVWQVIAEAERRGFAVDVSYVQQQIDVLSEECAEIEERWPDLNLNSPKQILAWFQSAGMPIPTTDKDFLQDVDHPLAQDILEYRGRKKILSTYFESFLELMDDRGYLHTNINPCQARTGRMSSDHPNLQNVPRGSFVRPALMASPGCTLVMADYAQIEYRIFASMANERQMIQAFLDGKDLHAETARIIIGRDPDGEERNTAKTANFSNLFGAGDDTFSRTAGISLAEGAAFRVKYDQAFPQAKRFMDAMMKYARSNGLAVENPYGRRLPVDSNQIYAATNYMVQSTAADVFKQGLVNIGNSEWGQYFILPVHDEAVFDVPEELADDLMAALPDLMEERTRFQVPLTIEVKKQRRWGVPDEEEAIAA